MIHGPLAGVDTMARDAIGISPIWDGPSSMRYFCSSLATVNFIFKTDILNATQLRGPMPKGAKAIFLILNSLQNIHTMLVD